MGHKVERARKLNILIIEDKTEISGELNKYINLIHCGGLGKKNNSSVNTVFEVMESITMLSLDQQKIDGMLIDIDMSKDNGIKDLKEVFDDKYDPRAAFTVNCRKSERASIKTDGLNPYGPILALPFLAFATKLFTVQPVSNFWENEELRHNGYFLTSLSLVLTAASLNSDEPRVIGIDDLYEGLRKKNFESLNVSTEGTSQVRMPKEGISMALERIRKILPDRFYFTDIDPISEEINQMERALSRSNVASYKKRFEEMSLNLIDFEGRSENILLSSIFADILVSDIFRKSIKHIRRKCNDWANGDDRTFPKTIAKIKNDVLEKVSVDQVLGVKRSTITTTSMLGKLGLESNFKQKVIARRYTALLAWTKSWFLKLTQEGFEKEHIREITYRCLGFNSGTKQYMSLIGLRSSQSDRLFPSFSREGTTAVSKYYLCDPVSNSQLSAYDIKVCRKYFQELCQQNDIDFSEAEPLLPNWLKC